MVVIGIVFAIAIPAFISDSIRAKLGNCTSPASRAQLAVNQRLMRTGRVPDNSAPAGFEFSETEFCRDIRVAGDGTVVIATRNTGADVDPVLQLRLGINNASAMVDWSCEFVSGDPAHVPPQCRNSGSLIAPGAGDSGGGSNGGGSGGGNSGGNGGICDRFAFLPLC